MQSPRSLHLAAVFYASVAVFHYGIKGGTDFSADIPLPSRYDSSRDASEDIRNALAQARKEDKRVFMLVGGTNWCSWCRFMEDFFKANPDLAALREMHYVTVRVYYGPSEPNTMVLSRYPKIPGYPHIFILDSSGAVLESKNTEELEAAGGTYSRGKFLAFLAQWRLAPVGK
ncbi:MAG: thioredoxin family protein [Elusimicrobia bacterium]|nr:thioredoxin family protein [Elusimicrobiota bacterium]